ncbi:hypothetical protein ABZ297_40040 [Nonomuraea sp. NPDC005983]|uniref:hypothetical protein n=1 Tax=Nonomuraea sp. NPDC005983 TaxID=3155595 RepID=UPI0033B7306E
MLALDFGAACVLVTTQGPITADDLTFARQLAHEAARYARSVERSLLTLNGGREAAPQGRAAA